MTEGGPTDGKKAMDSPVDRITKRGVNGGEDMLFVMLCVCNVFVLLLCVGN